MPLTDDQEIVDVDWEVYLRETARLIIEEQSPDRLADIRERLYELLTHCIPPDVIFQELLMELLRSCDAMLKAEVTSCAAEFEHRLRLGSKAIYHLEAFVAKFMSVYKKFLEATLSSLE
ncbi:unnamed protein product [Soboliphyme baturini]|uniref:Rep_fac_C domain-containing protein n=1 Tax=Soboliphyme baturini TaxID=241478 RepID=A0A183J2U5_9BILA|nr:unnamed protein product [Soboliphyme baturini]